MWSNISRSRSREKNRWLQSRSRGKMARLRNPELWSQMYHPCNNCHVRSWCSRSPSHSLQWSLTAEWVIIMVSITVYSCFLGISSCHGNVPDPIHESSHFQVGSRSYNKDHTQSQSGGLCKVTDEFTIRVTVARTTSVTVVVTHCQCQGTIEVTGSHQWSLWR